MQDLEATRDPLFFTQVVTVVCALLLTLGFPPFLVSLYGYYLVIFWAHWMLNVRSIDVCQLSFMIHWEVSKGDLRFNDREH